MIDHDQRKYPRHRCGAVIQYFFTEMGTSFAVRLIDFSEYGLGFTTGYELQPGKTLHLANRQEEEKRGSPCTAEVVYCIPAEGKSAFSYRVGVRFEEGIRRQSCLHWQDELHDCRLP